MLPDLELKTSPPDEFEQPDISHLITEDDTPVDNWFSEKQQRLGVDPLHLSPKWAQGRTFIASANVGLFDTVYEQAIVPDIFISLNVQIPQNWHEKRHRTYFIWEFGKPPELVVEIVSNRVGGELTTKKERYARMGVENYVVFDPFLHLGSEKLLLFERWRGSYQHIQGDWLESVGLGVRLWNGVFEGREAEWLRWYDGDGLILPTGAELAQWERKQAELAFERAEREFERAEHEAKVRKELEAEIARLQAELRGE